MHTWSAALRMDRCAASSTTPLYIILLSVMLRLTLSRGVQACCTPICGLTPRIYGLAQIIFWDLVEAKEVHSLRGHGSATVTCVACHPKAGDTSMVSKPPPLGRAYSNEKLYSSLIIRQCWTAFSHVRCSGLRYRAILPAKSSSGNSEDTTDGARAEGLILVGFLSCNHVFCADCRHHRGHHELR